MIRTTKVTLEIKWDDTKYPNPTGWDWDVLLSDTAAEEVKVIDNEIKEDRDWYRSLDN
jgi:hypothetical protein